MGAIIKNGSNTTIKFATGTLPNMRPYIDAFGFGAQTTNDTSTTIVAYDKTDKFAVGRGRGYGGIPWGAGKKTLIETDAYGCSGLKITINGSNLETFIGKIYWAITPGDRQLMGTVFHIFESLTHGDRGWVDEFPPRRGAVWFKEFGTDRTVGEDGVVVLNTANPKSFTDTQSITLMPSTKYCLWTWCEPEAIAGLRYNGEYIINYLNLNTSMVITPTGKARTNTTDSILTARPVINVSSDNDALYFGDPLTISFYDSYIQGANYRVTAKIPLTNGTYRETVLQEINYGYYKTYDPQYKQDRTYNSNVYKNSAEEIEHTFSISEYGPLITDKHTTKLIIQVDVYYGGYTTGIEVPDNVFAGSATKEFTISFPDSLKPVGIPAACDFSIYNTDADKVGWAENLDLVIQNHSRIKATFDRTAVQGTYDRETGTWTGGTWTTMYGAYLTKWVYTVRQNDTTKTYEYDLTNPNSYVDFSISDPIAANATVGIRVYDSRGNYVDVSDAFTVTPFKTPSVQMTQGESVWRSALVIDDSVDPPVVTDDEYESEDGRFMSVNIRASISDVAGSNIMTVKVASKRRSETDTGNIDTWPRVDVFAYPSSDDDSATQITKVGVFNTTGTNRTYNAYVTLGKNYEYDHTTGVEGRKTEYVTMGEVAGEMTFVTETTRNYEAAASSTGYEDVTYDIWVQITDRLGYQANFKGVMYSAKWAMKFMPDASGVSFGKSAEFSNRLDIPDTWDFYTGDYPLVSSKREKDSTTGALISLDMSLTLKDNARANIGILRNMNVVVPRNAWSQDATYAAYPYRATIPLDYVSVQSIPEVFFDADEIMSGTFAPFANTYGTVNTSDLPSSNGGVYIYASQIPTGSITIPVIITVG